MYNSDIPTLQCNQLIIVTSLADGGFIQAETDNFTFGMGLSDDTELWKMVRNYARTTDIGSFFEDSMKESVKLVQNGMSIHAAAEMKGVKYPTLFRYVCKATMHADEQEELKFRPNYDCRRVFSVEQEKMLEDYILQCSKIFYGLSTEQRRKLAYEMVVINQIAHPSNWDEQKIVGIEWFRFFLKRNSKLSIHTPEGCSLSRATSFNKSNIDNFFNYLHSLYEDCPEFATGMRVFNLNETCTSTVQKPPKVVAERGVKQVSKCTSAEKGTSLTTCCIVSATGNTIPPAMVFLRVHFKPHMIDQAPPGTLGLANSSGWMTSELFKQVMKHFIKHSKSSKAEPTLLLCDNHESLLSIEVLQIAKNNGVTILTFPPHSTNRLQPLDVGVYKPFKTFYNAAVDNWLMEHSGQTFSICNVASCVNIAHQKAMTPTNIVALFCKTGIFPFDKDVFTEADFLGIYVTDRPCEAPVEQESLLTEKDHMNPVHQRETRRRCLGFLLRMSVLTEKLVKGNTKEIVAERAEVSLLPAHQRFKHSKKIQCTKVKHYKL